MIRQRSNCEFVLVYTCPGFHGESYSRDHFGVVERTVWVQCLMYLDRRRGLFNELVFSNHTRGNDINTGARVYSRIDNSPLDSSGDSHDRNRGVGVRLDIGLNRRVYISINNTNFFLLDI